ncbi:MAG: glycosyltransferase [Promethearchaeota archaeon]
MRLSLDRDLDGSRGLQKFGASLIECLRDNFDVQLVGAQQKSDVHLVIIQGALKPGARNVVRIDGVYYDVKRLGMNGSIARSLARMDGVIYQSSWCKIFAENMLKVKPRRFAVIHNGTDQSKFENVPVDKMGFDEVFLVCAHWRINKRLQSVVESFLEARAITGKNLGLFVLGKADYICDSLYVKYFDYVTGSKFYSLYRSSDYMCHICHLDACPNSVVEGLSAGLPVLCNNIGGTPELVKSDGIVLKLDKPFDFKPIKSMEIVGPNSVDNTTLINGMLQMMEKSWDVNRPDLDISVSAKRYYDFFQDLL